MINPIRGTAHGILLRMIDEIEKEFSCDCICIYGPISDGLITITKDKIEALKKEKKHDKLCVVLTTNGGDVTSTERLVKIFRHNYKHVKFIIPDHAYSAGTLLCMSGNEIWMDYSSVLGPIDPQVYSKENKMYVPASGYVEKINRLLEKAYNNTISEAEFLILKDFDLAELSLYEQAIDLTVVLLKEWLVKYKFFDWDIHTKTKKKVTKQEKIDRAEKIAKELGNYNKWKSHGRPLDITTLTSLKLMINDYSGDANKSQIINNFHSMIEDFMELENMTAIILTRTV